MIVYNPTDGEAYTTSIKSCPRQCFLITRLGKPIHKMVRDIGQSVNAVCNHQKYSVVDASTQVGGRDFLIKIWKMIAASPVCVGVVHESIPANTQANIFYELGVAQAMGKETVIVKGPNAQVPSDFVRTEYIVYDKEFGDRFTRYMNRLQEIADYYALIAEQLESNPLLSIDYLRRAYLISGKRQLKKQARQILKSAGLQGRAKNSVELLAAGF